METSKDQGRQAPEEKTGKDSKKQQGDPSPHGPQTKGSPIDEMGEPAEPRREIRKSKL